jgi:flagellar motility protein MotE (MotC chaperone)
MTRLFPIALALLIGLAAGVAIGDFRARERAADATAQAEARAREAAQLRTQRDMLVSELADNRRAALERETHAEQLRADLTERLARLEQLIAALVGTRHGEEIIPTPSRSPGDEEVSGSN